MTHMTRIGRLAGLAVALASVLFSPVWAQSVTGFERLTFPDGAGPAIEGGVWFPRDTPPGTALPLVVISHGNGGSYSGHAATAEALARAGFIAAALTHTGDNWRDQSRATDVAERPRQLRVLIDHMVASGAGPVAVDPGRIGAFGFSSGGFTVLVAAGGTPDLRRVGAHCRQHPAFYDCRLIGERPPSAEALSTVWAHDDRIRAVVAAAPALGYTFGTDGLAKVTARIQLWRAEEDRVLPHPFYAQAVHDALPTPPEYHVVPAAGHFDFMPPCSPELAQAAPLICQPTPGLDRAVFQDDFNRQVVDFFDRTLARE